MNKYNPAQSSSTYTDPYSSSVPDPQQINIAWPSQRPPNLTNVPGDFIGFGIETVFLDDFTVGQFSANMMDNIGDRVGERLIIRVGGTSGDEVLFDPDQKETKICIHGDCPLGSSAQYILGPSYFEAFKAFPNQRFTFQAPMGPRLNISGSMDYVTRAYENIGSDRVAAIALGNEPDLYQKLWGLEYDAEKYVHDARVLADEIIKYFAFVDNATQIFEVGDVSGFGNFDLPDIFAAGYQVAGRQVKYGAQHYYQLDWKLKSYDAASCAEFLMNHTAISAKLQGKNYLYSEQYLKDFGAALWLVDFNLYGMSIGIQRIDNTQRPASNHSLWVPDNSADNRKSGDDYSVGPQVRAPYAALPMLADFIGTDPGPFVELLGEDYFSAYAVMDDSSWTPKRVALVNLNYWSSDMNTTRPTRSFTLPVGPDIRNVTVQRLSIKMGVRAMGMDVQGDEGMITWGGATWSYKVDEGVAYFPGAPQVETVQTSANGSAVIPVQDSEAVIVILQLPVAH